MLSINCILSFSIVYTIFKFSDYIPKFLKLDHLFKILKYFAIFHFEYYSFQSSISTHRWVRQFSDIYRNYYFPFPTVEVASKYINNMISVISFPFQSLDLHVATCCPVCNRALSLSINLSRFITLHPVQRINKIMTWKYEKEKKGRNLKARKTTTKKSLSITPLNYFYWSIKCSISRRKILEQTPQTPSPYPPSPLSHCLAVPPLGLCVAHMSMKC